MLEICTTDPVGSTGAALHLSRLMATATVVAIPPPCEGPAARSYLARFEARAGEVWVVLIGPAGGRLERRIPWLDDADRPLIRLESAGRLPDLSLLLESLLAEDRLGPLPSLGPEPPPESVSIGSVTDGSAGPGRIGASTEAQRKGSPETSGKRRDPKQGKPKGRTAMAGRGPPGIDTSPSPRDAGRGERADGVPGAVAAGGTDPAPAQGSHADGSDASPTPPGSGSGPAAGEGESSGPTRMADSGASEQGPAREAAAGPPPEAGTAAPPPASPIDQALPPRQAS
ncbi:MAG TPA: hypothetical protein VGD74_00405, partial [Vulgatibacter sp.]